MHPQPVDVNGSQEEAHACMHRLLLFTLARESAFVVLQRRRNHLKLQTRQLQQLHDLELKQIKQEEEQQRHVNSLKEKKAFLLAALNRVLQDLRVCEMLDRLSEAARPRLRGDAVASVDWSKEGDRETSKRSHAKERKMPELESALVQQKQVLIESAASLRACCEEALLLKEAIGQMSGDIEGDHWTTEAQGLSLPSDCLLGADADLLAAEERLFALEAEVDASLRELPALEGLQQHLLQKAISSIPDKPSRPSTFRTVDSTSGETAHTHDALLNTFNSPRPSPGKEISIETIGRMAEGRSSSGVELRLSDSAATQREGERKEASPLFREWTSSHLENSHDKGRTHSPASGVYTQLPDESAKRADAAESFEREESPRYLPSHKGRDEGDLHSAEELWLLDKKTAGGWKLHASQQHPPSPSAHLDRPRFHKEEERVFDGLCMHASEVEGFPQEWCDFSHFQHLTGCAASVATTGEVAFNVSLSKEAAGLQGRISTPLVKAATAGHAADRMQGQLGPDLHTDESDHLQSYAAAQGGTAGVAVRKQRAADFQEVMENRIQKSASDEAKPNFCGPFVLTIKEEKEDREAESETPAITFTSNTAAQVDNVASQTHTDAALVGQQRQSDLTAATAAALSQQSGLRVSDLCEDKDSCLWDGGTPQTSDHVLRHYETQQEQVDEEKEDFFSCAHEESARKPRPGRLTAACAMSPSEGLGTFSKANETNAFANEISGTSRSIGIGEDLQSSAGSGDLSPLLLSMEQTPLAHLN